jgi:hypothetical protein
MPAPVFQAAGPAVGGLSALSPAWPLNHLTNDIGILVVETGGEGSTLTISTPAGWATVPGSPVTDVATTAGSKLQVFWKRAASASEANAQVPDSGDHQTARIITFRGCVTTGNPWDVIGTDTKTTASTTVTWPSVTTTVAETLCVFIASRPDDNSSLTVFGAISNANLTGIGEAAENGSTAGHGGGFVVAYGQKATAGAIGSTTSTTTVSTTNAEMVIALKPLVVINLSADPGSYSLTGAAATLLETFILSADPGSYSLTGVDASLIFTGNTALVLSADPGSYSLSGADATLLETFILSADPGSYSLTGFAATLLETKTLSADPGAYSLTGVAATLLENRALSADPGSYSLSGAAATLIKGDIFSVDPGAYNATGNDAFFTKTRVFVADPGTYSLVGSNASLVIIGSLSADPGSYSVSGNASALLRNYSLFANSESYSLTGQSATLSKTKTVSADSGSYAVSGQAAAFVRTYNLLAAAGAFNVSGVAAEFAFSRNLVTSSGAYNLTGAPAQFVKVVLYPSPGDVREGVVYGPGGIYTGTLKAGGKILFIFDD